MCRPAVEFLKSWIGSQQFHGHHCLPTMERQGRKLKEQKEGVKDQGKVTMEQLVYEADTPKWRSYYERVRKTIRFPRYYKKEQNW